MERIGDLDHVRQHRVEHRPGAPIYGSNILRCWQSILAEAEVPYQSKDGHGRGLHELRRSFATMLRQRGVPIEETTQLGRWSSPRILLDHYSGTEDDHLRGAVDALGDAYSQA